MLGANVAKSSSCADGSDPGDYDEPDDTLVNTESFAITGFLASEKLQIETVSLLKIRQSSELDQDISTSTGDTMRSEILRNYYFEIEDSRRNPAPPVQYRTIMKSPVWQNSTAVKEQIPVETPT